MQNQFAHGRCLHIKNRKLELQTLRKLREWQEHGLHVQDPGGGLSLVDN